MALEKAKGNLHTGVRPRAGISALLPLAKSLGEIWRTFGSPCEVYFRYNAKMEGYANSSPDITELSDISLIENESMWDFNERVSIS